MDIKKICQIVIYLPVGTNVAYMLVTAVKNSHLKC